MTPCRHDRPILDLAGIDRQLTGRSRSGSPGVAAGPVAGLSLLLIASLALGPEPAWGADPGAPAAAAAPVSVIQIPLELDLGPLFGAAESALPTQAGQWPGWGKWHGIDVRYRAWRGPLMLSMQGDVVQAQAHVRYQLQARKGLIGSIGLSAGCGVDEPPRQALIGLLARLDWGPDWSLHPRLRVLPTRMLDRCEVTVADIDVSPMVGRAFEERIESSLRQAMGVLAPRLRNLRTEAARAWQAMQAPRELAPGLWLRVQPLGLALAPPQGSGSRVQTAVWLAFRAALSGDGAPVGAATRLPPLVPFRPAQPGLRFAIGLTLDYPRLSAALSERLAGQTLEIGGKQARLGGIELAARGEDLFLSARLSGDLAGQFTLMGRPGFDADSQSLRLEQVDFVYDAADPDQGMAASLFYDQIRDRIETQANALLAERSQVLREALGTILGQGLRANLAPNLSGLRISNLKLTVGETGLTLDGSAEGALTIGRSEGR